MEHTLEDTLVDIRMDEDGEMRILGIEGTLLLRMNFYEEQEMELLEDIYSLQEQCIPEKQETVFEELLMQNQSRYILTERLSLPEFLDDVAKKGNYIMDTIKSWGLDEIVEVRGRGLMIGIEIKQSASEVEKIAAQKGLLILTAGEHVVRLLPPLVITMDEINKGLEILKQCL